MSNPEIEAVVARKNPTPQQTIPSLVAVHMNGGWAVISDDKRRPLTQVEAHRIIAAYFALHELWESTI